MKLPSKIPPVQRWRERVIIRRDRLKSVEGFAGTLLHEITHAISGYSDVSREFKLELTKITGKLAFKILD